MLAKFIQFVKNYERDIVLVVGVVLISLLSFAVGYISAKQYGKEPINLEEINVEQNESSNYWRGDLRAVSFLEAL